MSNFLVLLVALGALLGVLAWALFRGIGWLRKSSTRYFFLELFAALGVVAFGAMLLVASPRTRIPQWIFGLSILLMGIWNALTLFARRFGWTWLSAPLGRKKLLRCSFCNKSQRDVTRLIAGPGAHICDECVAVCNQILVEEGGRIPEPEKPEPTPV